MITADKVTIGLNVGGSSVRRIEMLRKVARVFRYDAMWTVDHYLGWVPQQLWDKGFLWNADPQGTPHAYLDWQVLLGHLAGRSGRIQVGVAVTEAVRRHPVTLAQAAMTLSHLTKEPPILGIGAGETENTVPYGLDFSRPVRRLEEALQIIRSCFTSRGAFDFEGEVFRLDKAILDLAPPPDRVPQIWIAGHGPRMLSLVGRFGDGWYPTLPYTPGAYADSLALVRTAAVEAGRDPATIVPAWSAIAVLGKTERDARRLLDTPYMRFMSLLAPDEVWQRHGETHPLGEGFAGLVAFVPQWHTEAEIRAARAAVPVDLVADTVLWGTPDAVLSRLRDFVDAGLRHLVLNPASALASRRDMLFSLRAAVSLSRKLRDSGTDPSA